MKQRYRVYSVLDTGSLLSRVSKASNHFNFISSDQDGSNVGNLANTISSHVVFPEPEFAAGDVSEFLFVPTFTFTAPFLLIQVPERDVLDLFNINGDKAMPASPSKLIKNLMHLRPTSPVT